MTPLTSCHSERVLSHTAETPEVANLSESCTQLNPGPFADLKMLQIFSVSLCEAPLIKFSHMSQNPPWVRGERRAVGCASETEPERCFSLKTEGSERQTEIFWELWKMKCSRLSTYGSCLQLSDPPKVHQRYQTWSLRGETKRNQMHGNYVLMCWLKFLQIGIKM